MLTLHDDIELICGDEWQIAGQLLQEDGSPLNLEPTVQINWALLDPDGKHVLELATHTEIERIDPVSSGKVLITIDEALTRTFRPGRYTNAIRAAIGGAPATLWRGIILAGADPFYAEM
jgi:hypothetical protein